MRNVELASILTVLLNNFVGSTFSGATHLSRVTFGESSSLQLVGEGPFDWSRVRKIHLPDSVEQLYHECFYNYKSISRVTFDDLQ